MEWTSVFPIFFFLRHTSKLNYPRLELCFNAVCQESACCSTKSETRDRYSGVSGGRRLPPPHSPRSPGDGPSQTPSEMSDFHP
jgi:hypothetical protein